MQSGTAARMSVIRLPFPPCSAILDIALIGTTKSTFKPEQEKKGKAVSFQARHEVAHVLSICIPLVSTLSMDVPQYKGVWEMWS